jgi:hypothetical protein
MGKNVGALVMVQKRDKYFLLQVPTETTAFVPLQLCNVTINRAVYIIKGIALDVITVLTLSLHLPGGWRAVTLVLWKDSRDLPIHG